MKYPNTIKKVSKNMEKQNKRRYLEWGISFWLGIGLISIINIWKIVENQHALSYSWIMFGISIIMLIICIILIKRSK